MSKRIPKKHPHKQEALKEFKNTKKLIENKFKTTRSQVECFLQKLELELELELEQRILNRKNIVNN